MLGLSKMEKNKMKDPIETNNKIQVENRCVRCKKLIEPGAVVCHQCGKHQNNIIYYTNQFATFTALFMVMIAGAQVYVNILQMREARVKRIEAQQVLEEARSVLSKAVGEAQKLRTQAKNVLNTAKSETEIAIKEAQMALKDSKAQTLEAKQAVNKAKKEISDTINYVNNETTKLNDSMQKTELEFKTKFRDIAKNIKMVKNELSKEVEILKTRNELVLLADKAIGSGCRDSYEKLYAMIFNGKDKTSEINMAALSEVLRVKTFYLGGSRIKGFELHYTEGDGSIKKDGDISTKGLIRTLKNSKNWRYRAKAAQLLKLRKEKVAVNSLIVAMLSDKRLDVKEECIKSFSTITGYKKADVFNHKPVIIWWTKNKDKVLQELDQN